MDEEKIKPSGEYQTLASMIRDIESRVREIEIKLLQRVRVLEKKVNDWGLKNE